MTSPRISYLLGAAAVALPSGLLLAWALGLSGRPILGAAALGWLLASTAGATTGAWAAARHGLPGAGFFLAAFVGTAIRAAVLVVAVPVWMRSGGEGAFPYLAGAAAGLVPQWGFEIVWFARRGRARRGHRSEDRP